jgi:transposase
MDDGHLYVFFGMNRRRLKLLWYDGTGLILATKKLEHGSFMLLEDLLGRAEITQAELKLILHGSFIKTPLLDRFAEDKKQLLKRKIVDSQIALG